MTGRSLESLQSLTQTDPGGAADRDLGRSLDGGGEQSAGLFSVVFTAAFSNTLQWCNAEVYSVGPIGLPYE